MRQAIIFAIAALILASPSQVAASQRNLEKQIARCAIIGNAIKRGECYDILASELGLAKPAQTSSVNGGWTTWTDVSKIDDSRNVYMQLSADVGVSQGRYKNAKPTLLLRCMENRTSLYITYSIFLGSDNTMVTTRIDSESAETKKWSISSDHYSVGLWDGQSAVPFIKKMLGKKNLVVRIVPYSESAITASFTLQGMATGIKELSDVCGWKM